MARAAGRPGISGIRSDNRGTGLMGLGGQPSFSCGRTCMMESTRWRHNIRERGPIAVVRHGLCVQTCETSAVYTF